MPRIPKLLLVICLALAGCAHMSSERSEAMDRPIEFESSSQFYRALQTLENEISSSDYQRLTDSVGYLQAHDLENLDYEDFHLTLAGMTPNQIIEKADILSEGD